MSDHAPASALTDSRHAITEVDGFTIVSERVPQVRSVALGAWVAVGSAHETSVEAGYAHFLEHLLFKGNERWSAADISRYFDGIGSDANAATTKEYTVVHARVLDRHLPDVLEVMGELVLAPAFDRDEFAAEREVILEEIAMYDDAPSDVVHELADLLVFGSTPLGLPIVGNARSIADALVDQVAAFHDRHYRPGNIVVSAAGNVDHDEFVDLVRARMLKPNRTPSRSSHSAAPAELAAPLPRAAHVIHKETEQVHLVMAGRGIRRSDPRRYAAALLDTILGNAPSSRLFLEIRERRGLAYSVYSFISNYRDSGQIGIYVGVRPDRVDEVLAVVRDELSRFADHGPSTDELQHAMRHLEGRMLLSLESTTVRGNRLGAALITGMPIEPLSTTLERIRSVTVDDIRALANDLLHPDKLHVAAVADDVAALTAAIGTHFGVPSDAFAVGARRARSLEEVAS